MSITVEEWLYVKEQLMTRYRFVEDHAEDAAKGIAQTQGGDWFGVRSVDRVLIGVFGAPTQSAVEQSLEGVLRRIDAGSGPA